MAREKRAFQIIDEIGEKEYDRICVQYGSGCLPEERAEPLYWIVYSEDHGDWEKTVSGIRQKRLSFLPLRSVDRSKRRWRKQDLLEDAVCGLMNQLEAYGTEDENQIITLEIKEKTQKRKRKKKLKNGKDNFHQYSTFLRNTFHVMCITATINVYQLYML